MTKTITRWFSIIGLLSLGMAALSRLSGGSPLLAVNMARASAVESSPASPLNSSAPAGIIINRQRCWALDLIVLVDQSQSMFNPSLSPGGVPSDPQSYRFKAVQEAINNLFRNRQFECEEAEHRLGMITFGHTAKTILPLVSINPGPDDRMDDWTSEYRARIGAEAGDRSMTATNPQLAFEAALDLLSNATPVVEPVGYEARRKVVVLLTDGNPDLGRGNEPKNMCNLISSLDTAAWQGVNIWVLALRAGDSYLNLPGCNGAVRDSWMQIAQAHNGQLLEAPYNEHVIPDYLNRVISSEFGHPGTPISCGDFYLDPYLQKATLSFSRKEEDANLTVILSMLDAQGNVAYQVVNGAENILQPEEKKSMSLLEHQYFRDAIWEQYTILKPRPGRWNLSIEGLSQEECQARIMGQLISVVSAILVEPNPDAVLLQVKDSPYYNQAQPLTFKIKLVTDNNQDVIIEPEPDYTLTVSLQWRLPSGAQTLPNGVTPQTTFDLTPTTEGTWGNPAAIVLTPEEGVYQANISGKTISGDHSKEYDLFTNQTVSYHATYREPFYAALQAPVAGEKMFCNDPVSSKLVGMPIPVRVQIQNRGRQASAANTYFPDVGQAVEAVLTDASGGVVEQVRLSPGTRDASILEGVFFNKGELAGCDKVNLTINVVGGYDQSRFLLLEPSQSISLYRPIVTGVHLELVDAPTRVSLHGKFCPTAPQPVQFEAKMIDQLGNSLNPAEVGIGEIKDLYSVRLSGPGMKEWEDIDMQLLEHGDGYQLSFTGGISPTTLLQGNVQAYLGYLFPLDP